jgi:hypothetical protein
MRLHEEQLLAVKSHSPIEHNRKPKTPSNKPKLGRKGSTFSVTSSLMETKNTGSYTDHIISYCSSLRQQYVP